MLRHYVTNFFLFGIEFAWVWSTQEEGGQAGNIILDAERRQINFNPEYSSGTASVRGNQILPKNYQHYWEVKLTSAVYGTNIVSTKLNNIFLLSEDARNSFLRIPNE